MTKEYEWYNRPCIELKTADGILQVSLFGGHILQWQPTGHSPVLWMSNVPPAEGKPLRGGIPICWPWFGPKEGYGGHGWARNATWKANQVSDSSLTMTLSGVLEHVSGQVEYELTQKLMLTEASLTQMLSFKHNGPEALPFQSAFHSYFSVSHPADVKISGIENKPYQDKLDNLKLKQTPELIDANLAWDATINSDGNWTMEDKKLNRRISCTAINADTTVLWHPSDETTQKMADIHPGGNSEFLCLETANLNSPPVPANEVVEISQKISVEAC